MTTVTKMKGIIKHAGDNKALCSQCSSGTVFDFDVAWLHTLIPEILSGTYLAFWRLGVFSVL